MPRPWEADSEVSMEQAAYLIERQFPELSPLRIEPYGAGWDNMVFLVNGSLVFRFPRRKLAVPLIEHEMRVLREIAPHLTLPIPVPAFLGTSGGAYPYPFAGYAQLPGTTACRAGLTDSGRTQMAVPLAIFLAGLHGIPIDAATLAWAPRDELDRANVAKRGPMARQRLQALEPRLPDTDIPILLKLIDSLTCTSAFNGTLHWVHGDLYARHLLVDSAGWLCGAIDWGDVHLGDPAIDLSIAFSFLPPHARSLFRSAYGVIDGPTWDRARFRALHYGIILIEYGSDVDDAAIKAAGEYALRSAAC